VLGDSSHTKAIFAECKWRKEIKDISVLNKLIEKSAMFPRFPEKYYYLFSGGEPHPAGSAAGSGKAFSKPCRDLADNY
jgi:hypothetical protein